MEVACVGTKSELDCSLLLPLLTVVNNEVVEQFSRLGLAASILYCQHSSIG